MANLEILSAKTDADLQSDGREVFSYLLSAGIELLELLRATQGSSYSSSKVK